MAHVEGRTENDLLKLGFERAYMFRPGYIQPLDGIWTKTRVYAIFCAILAPFYPVFKAVPGASRQRGKSDGR